jgi:hypothetical protein
MSSNMARQRMTSYGTSAAFDIHLLKDEDILGFHRLLPPFRAKRMDCAALGCFANDRR